MANKTVTHRITIDDLNHEALRAWLEAVREATGKDYEEDTHEFFIIATITKEGVTFE